MSGPFTSLDTLKPRFGRFSAEAFQQRGGSLMKTPEGIPVCVTCCCTEGPEPCACGFHDLVDVGYVTERIGACYPSAKVAVREEGKFRMLAEWIDRIARGPELLWPNPWVDEREDAALRVVDTSQDPTP